LWLLLLAIILIPFFLFGQQIETWTQQLVNSANQHPLLTGITLAALLASDILLPIPSSMVSTACGLLLGPLAGTISSLTGMTISCIAGYWLGRSAGRSAARKMIGPDELEILEGMNRRFGDWVIIVCRPVPVLAEASVLFLGISRASFPRFMAISTLSNFGISAVYATIGSLSASAELFLPAFAASILIPLIAMLIAKRSPEQR
jgi:uncharacterized membrane protein YdjX (TVP38/TMEM64 family)